MFSKKLFTVQVFGASNVNVAEININLSRKKKKKDPTKEDLNYVDMIWKVESWTNIINTEAVNYDKYINLQVSDKKKTLSIFIFVCGRQKKNNSQKPHD